MKHVRAIVNNQAFLTGDTHEVIITKYGIPRIHEVFCEDLRRVRQAQQQNPDWMHDPTWQTHLEAQLAVRQQDRADGSPERPPGHVLSANQCFPPKQH